MFAAVSVGVGILTAVGVLLLPVLATGRFRATRSPTDEERSSLDALREWADLDVDRVHMVDADDAPSLHVQVAGLPGRRHLFVTADVVESLPDELGASLLAAETGRMEAGYNLARALSVGFVFGLLTATASLLVPFGPGMVGIGVAGLVAFWIGRRLQYLSDRLAAERVGADTLADAFEHVAQERGVEPETGSWRTIFEVQPPLGDRIERLRDLP